MGKTKERQDKFGGLENILCLFYYEYVSTGAHSLFAGRCPYIYDYPLTYLLELDILSSRKDLSLPPEFGVLARTTRAFMVSTIPDR